MNNIEVISIGFGNMSGQTSATFISDHRSRIEIGTMTATHVEAPRIQVKKHQERGMGALAGCVNKKRDKLILTELLKVNI